MERGPAFRTTLVCWHCGKSRDISTHGPAMFAFEVAAWANDAGMLGVIDHDHGRALVFCGQGCAREELTKKGRFRLRPKRSAVREVPE